MVAHVVPGLGDNGSTLLLCHEGDYKSCLATKSTGRSKGIDFAPLGGGAAPYSPRQPSTVVFSPRIYPPCWPAWSSTMIFVSDGGDLGP